MLLFPTFYGQAQEVKNGMYVGLGLSRAYFQDLEYSAYTHQNSGINFRLGYQSLKESHKWNAGLEVKGLIGSAFEQEWLQYTIYPSIHFSYLKNVSEVLSGQLMLGGRIDLLDVNVFINDALSNNAGYYFWSSNLHLASEWNKSLNDKWDFHAAASLVVLGFTKELTSFAFSVPEELIEQGEFHYQIDNTGPLNFKYFKPRTLGQYNRVRTEIGFTSKQRHRFAYQWELVRFEQTKDRPLTFGNHNLKWTLFFGKRKDKS